MQAGGTGDFFWRDLPAAVSYCSWEARGFLRRACGRRMISATIGNNAVRLTMLGIFLMPAMGERRASLRRRRHQRPLRREHCAYNARRFLSGRSPWWGRAAPLSAGRTAFLKRGCFPGRFSVAMRMSVTMEDYPVPIDVNEHAAEIDVEPDRTTITYSHANFTIRQIMLAPKCRTRARERWCFTKCRRSAQ